MLSERAAGRMGSRWSAGCSSSGDADVAVGRSGAAVERTGVSGGRCRTYVRALTAALVGSAAAAMPSAAAGAVYNAANDFSLSANPSGVWSYGYEDRLGAPLHLYNQPTANWRGATGLDGWTFSTLPLDPNISHNRSTSILTLSDTGVHLPANGLTIHPGAGGEPSVLRWTAPTAGVCDLAVAFRGNDETGTTTDVHVLHNNVSLFDGQINAYGSGPSFSASLPVAAGDTVDFAAGYGRNSNYLFDSTGVAATVTLLPEPGGLFAACLVSVALLRRRR